MRDNMRKQRLTIRKETKTLRDDLLNTATEEASTESLSEQGRRYIKEVSLESRSWIQQLVKEQEEMIDDLSSGVKRLNEMAHTIQDEIQQHDQLIDGVEIEVDVAQTRLERGRKEIERFLKTRSDRIEWRIDCLDWCLIKTIFFLFLFTVFFVFYTFIS